MTRLGGVLLVSVLVASCHTNNMYPGPWHNPECNGNVCRADNAGHWYNTDELGPRMLEATDAAIGGSWDPGTDLTFTYDPTPVTSGDYETDIIFDYGDAGSSLAVVVCDDPIEGSSRCDQFYIYYDADNIIEKFGEEQNNGYRAVACHEIGHTIGLMHGADSNPAVGNDDAELGCMRTPAETSTWQAGGHNFGVVNATYQ